MASENERNLSLNYLWKDDIDEIINSSNDLLKKSKQIRETGQNIQLQVEEFKNSINLRKTNNISLNGRKDFPKKSPTMQRKRMSLCEALTLAAFNFLPLRFVKPKIDVLEN